MDRDTFESAARAMAGERGYVTAALLASELGLGAVDAKRLLQKMYDGGSLELDLEGDDFVYRLKGATKPGAARQPAKAGPMRLDDDAPGPPISQDGDTLRRRPPESGRQRKSKRAHDAPEHEQTGGSSVGEGFKEATVAMMTRSKTALAHAAVGALMEDAGAQKVTEEQKKSMLWGVGLGLFVPGIGLFYAAPIVTASLCTALVLLTLGLLQLIPVLGALLSYFLFGFFMLASGALGGAYTYYFNKTGRRTRLRKGGKGLRALPF